jgi:hypothetical protein
MDKNHLSAHRFGRQLFQFYTEFFYENVLSFFDQLWKNTEQIVSLIHFDPSAFLIYLDNEF